MIGLAVFAVLVSSVVAHPLCGLDREEGFESPLPRTLQFCTQYEESTCCTLQEDNTLLSEFSVLNLSRECAEFYQRFVCSRCDPYQAHLFDLESNNPPRSNPFLCDGFIVELIVACGAEIENEIIENETFFEALSGTAPYCLPVSLPQAGNSGLEVYREIQNARLIDYAAAGPNLEYYASFDGKLYEDDGNGALSVAFEFRDIFNQGELGFLTFELDPDFDTNRFIWTYHSVQESLDGGPNTRYTILSRLRLHDSPGQPDELCPIIRIEQRGWNHNGGDIEILDDSFKSLLLSLGDDAPQNGDGKALDNSNIYGTVLRIIPDRTESCNINTPYRDPSLPENIKETITDNYIPHPDNPFISDGDKRSEILWYGFRNPWRTFRVDDFVYIGDVGQQLWEEVDIGDINDPGANYGWDIAEGDNCFKVPEDCDMLFSDPMYRWPVYDYPHFPNDLRPSQQHLGFSLSLGHVYTGTIRPELAGKVLMGDYITQQIWAIVPTGIHPWRGAELVVAAAGSVVTLRKDWNGETVVLTLGEVAYKLKEQDDPASTYRNGVCEVGENCKDDFYDCPGDLKGQPKWCCEDGECSLGICEVDCGATAAEVGCGNNYCDVGEDCQTCKWDCPGHEDANDSGNEFCCSGTEFGAVTCTGEGCNDDSCRRGNKQGDRDFKSQHDRM